MRHQPKGVQVEDKGLRSILMMKDRLDRRHLLPLIRFLLQKTNSDGMANLQKTSQNFTNLNVGLC